MKRYYRIMLGAKSIHADECYRETFIGGDFGIDTNLSGLLPDIWREFNQKFIPVWLSKNPGKSKVAAGLACGALWTIAKGTQLGDLVICPNGTGSYWVAEVTGNYQYAPDSVLPHRRAVRWYPLTIDRAAMSEALRNSSGSIGTVSDITKYAAEIEAFVSAQRPPTLLSTDDSIEDPVTFALEKHLESFLVSNWSLTASEARQGHTAFAQELKKLIEKNRKVFVDALATEGKTIPLSLPKRELQELIDVFNTFACGTVNIAKSTKVVHQKFLVKKSSKEKTGNSMARIF